MLVAARSNAQSNDDLDLTVNRHTSEVRLMAKGEQPMSFSEWFQTCLVQNKDLRRGILIEPLIEWDNEVTCLSVGGGEIIVIGSKGGGLVRSGFAQAATRGSHMPVDPIVVVRGRSPLVVLQRNVSDERRERYQLQGLGFRV